MKTYIVILGLTQGDYFYSRLNTYLKSSGGWAKPYKGVWLVKASIDPIKIRAGILERIHKSDSLVVLPIESANGWATYGQTNEINNWLKGGLQ